MLIADELDLPHQCAIYSYEFPPLAHVEDSAKCQAL